TVYLHGLVRDELGRKMTKSLGNGIDPLEMIEKYGTDALRLSLVVGSTPGTDLKFSETRVVGQRNFVNKLWNASRYAFGVLGEKFEIPKNPTPLSLPDRWILSKLNRLIDEVNRAFEKYAFAEAAGKIQDFVWHDFCDWYLELTKEKPNKKILAHTLAQILKLSHPFIPFVSEKLWENFFLSKKSSKAKPKLLALEKYPKPAKTRISSKVEAEMKITLAIISAIRSVRSEMNVPPARKIAAIAYVGKFEKFVKGQAKEIKKLARLNSFVVKKSGKKVENAVAKIEAEIEIYFPVAKLLDPKMEKKRLRVDLKEAQSYFMVISKKLKNKDFAARAPKNVVEAERAKLKDVEEKVKKIEERLNILGGKNLQFLVGSGRFVFIVKFFSQTTKARFPVEVCGCGLLCSIGFPQRLKKIPRCGVGSVHSKFCCIPECGHSFFTVLRIRFSKLESHSFLACFHKLRGFSRESKFIPEHKLVKDFSSIMVMAWGLVKLGKLVMMGGFTMM
ncbi:class I tRNA ligase family protein, partial [Candidatus Gracilibacteria bacterium]|nr:class I tRNA ligase family protein [Candidatus Gracilibacteria bacterium]